jgi:hypothetical protein
MIIELFNNLIQYILVKLYPEHYEYKSIKRVNSSGSFIEYCDSEIDNDFI